MSNPHTLAYVHLYGFRLAQVNTLAYVFKMTNKRLTKDDWVLAGFRALVQQGPQALKAEPLARALATTKGSFYWHFKDVPSFHTAMLLYWERHALDGIITLVETEGTPVASLRKLAQVAVSHDDPAYGGKHAEPAIRAWARSDPAVSKAVAEVDAKRLAYLQKLLTQCGVSNPELARALYAASLGMEELSTRDNADNQNAIGTLVDLILALR